MNEVGTSTEAKPIFRPLNADDPNPESTKIESLCISCGKNGITQILLTKIPFYKEVVLMSFECEECGYRNNEIQPGGQIEEKGIRITLNVNSSRDLNRQVCKSDYSSIKIPEIDFEIPSQSQKGEITTVEGVLGRSIEGLEALQPERRVQDPKNAEKIDEFLGRLRALKSGEKPFTMVLEDISGNSFISNPNAPMKDDALTMVRFARSKEQNHILGIYETGEISGEDKEAPVLKPIVPEEFAYEDIIQEVMQFQTNCSNCRSQCQTNMKLTNIPYFKEVVIMATNCEVCGHRSNEVKSGGGIEPKGLRIELKILDRDDFSRDILKSDTCSLQIPEIELDIGPAVLGGRFTTVEGLLVTAKEQLYESSTMFHDSQDPETKRRIAEFMDKFDLLLKLEKQFTLVLDDPAGNSYVQSFSESSPDDRLSFTKYERTFEQNEELGLNDIKTENYEEK